MTRSTQPFLFILVLALGGCAVAPPPNEVADILPPKPRAEDAAVRKQPLDISAYGTIVGIAPVRVDNSPPCPVATPDWPQWWVSIRCARPVRWYGGETRETDNFNLEIHLDSGQRITVETAHTEDTRSHWSIGQRVRVTRGVPGDRISVVPLPPGSEPAK